MATALDYVMGLGELGATLGTGAVSGVVGAPYGLYKGITSGKYGTPEAARIAQQEAANFMARNTYQPRGQVAQEALQGLGGLLSQSKLPPVLPEAMLLGQIPRQAYAAQAERAGMAAERAIEPVVQRTMAAGGRPAQLMQDLTQGSRRQIFVPASSEEAMKASRMLKTMKPEDVWRETGVGNWGGEYVKELSDKPAKFNTAQEIAANAQKIRDRNIELKQTIKESQSTYPDLFPKELTAARRPLREEIKSNQNMLERNYGYESDPKWAGNFAQLAYEHPELYKAFPELKNVVVRQGRDDPNFLGSYQRLPHLDVGSVDVTKSGLLNDPRSTATHEMQHAVSDLSGWQAGGAPEMFRQQEAAQMTKDALSWNKEIENASKRYPNEDRAFLESVVVNDYAKAGAPDWVPSIEARDMARLFSKYPEQLDEAQKLVKVYGLDRKTTPNSPDKVYKNLEGEALARLAQTRINLTPEERLQYFPFEQKTDLNKYGLDVNPDELIYRDTVEGLLGQQAKSASALPTDYYELNGMATQAYADLRAKPSQEAADYYKSIMKARDEAANNPSNNYTPPTPDVVPQDYKGQHQAPTKDGGAPLWDMKGIYPDDFYSSQGARFYGDGADEARDRMIVSQMQSMKGRPDKPVTIYRAVPKSVPTKEALNTGDWITLDRQYAKEHGEGALGGDYKIVKKTVKARDLFTNGDSIYEMGYDPQPYMPKSQRGLLD